MKTSITIVFAFLGYHLSFAQWEPINGPYGGDVFDLKQNNAYVFAATDNGLYRSNDGGNNWSKLIVTPNGIPTKNLGINGDTLVVVGYEKWGYYEPRLFKSNDNGDNWYSLNFPDTLEFVDVAVTDFAIYAKDSYTVLFSTDDGQSWQNSAVNADLTYSGGITSFNQQVYIGGQGKIYHSAPNADIWTALGNPGTAIGTSVIEVLGDVIFARDFSAAPFVSVDGGQSWQQSQTQQGWSNGWPSFVKIGETYYLNEISHVRKSADVGNTWTNVPINDRISFNNMIGYEGGLMAGAFDQGILRSTDFGQSFHPFNKGLDAAKASNLAISNGKLFAGCDYVGLYKYDIGTKEWDTTIYTPVRFSLYDVAAVKDKLFASIDNGEIVRSDDEGMTWENVTPESPFAGTGFERLTVDGDTLYAVGDWALGATGPLHKSTDLGENWAQFEIQVGGVNYEPMFFARNDEYLFTADLRNVFRSSDGGQNWEIINQSMGLVGQFSVLIDELIVANNRLFAILADGAYNRLYVSPNSEDQWELADGGISLLNFFGGIDKMISVGGVLVATTLGYADGIFVSMDNATSWQPFNEGLFGLACKEIVTDGTYLYAGMDGQGVWRRSLSDLNLQAVIDKRPQRNGQVTISPNPNAGSFTLVFKGDQSENVQLEVYDLHGRSILKSTALANQPKRIELPNSESGFYLLKGQSDKRCFSGRILLSKL